MKKIFLLVLSATLISAASFAQQDQNTLMKLGNVITHQPAGTGEGNASGTREDILADPTVSIIGRNITVSGFTFSMKPKGGEYWGPFTVKGDKLPANVIKRIKDLENPEGMIYIESIKALDERKVEQTFNPIIFRLVAAKK